MGRGGEGGDIGKRGKRMKNTMQKYSGPSVWL